MAVPDDIAGELRRVGIQRGGYVRELMTAGAARIEQLERELGRQENE